MGLVGFLFKASRRMVLALVLASAASGAISAALVALIHRALAPGEVSPRLIAASFVLAMLAKVGTQYLSQLLLVRFAQQVVLDLCRDLCDRILAAPLDRLERLGAPRLLATLNDDVMVLSGAVLIVPSIATHLAVLAGCSLYLAWLSWPVFLLCVGVAAVGVLGYRLLLGQAQAALAAARDGRDRLFGNYRTLIEGVKELKLNAARRTDFLRSEIDETTELLRDRNVAAIRRTLLADSWSQIVFFGLVGLLLFGAPALASIDQSTLTGYVFAALYMMGPMWALVGAVPTFLRGRVSLDKIRALDADLQAIGGRRDAAPMNTPGLPVHIDLQAATFAYPAVSADEPGFVLGPLDLALRPGELVFITGGNGCGKSTLVRLLTGLYPPTSGRVLLDDAPVDEGSREAYRQLFSVVFADFHLFERLFGLRAAERAGEIAGYLQALGMSHKVGVREDRFTTTALSSGQRRRLALLTAYLEDRPVYVFDEWAADQDPSYKDVFYTRLLPELKARGKCVVVVTHDDRYFSQGDRVVKLEAGRIVAAA